MKFYKCPICGNIITIIEGNDKLIKCCGVNLEELVPNVVDASTEKHLPIYEINDNNICVKVGEVLHPMDLDHYIMFVALVNGEDVHIVKLRPNESINIKFDYVKGSLIYSYCNIHGLWMSEVK